LRRNELFTNTAVADAGTISAENISTVKVTIHIPDEVSDTIRQQKINRLYDILKPKIEMQCCENKDVA